MPQRHKQMIDLLDRLRLEEAEVVTKTLPRVRGRLVRIAGLIGHAQDLPQGAMVFRQVLQSIVIAVAAQTYSGQDENLPVREAGTAPCSLCGLVDVTLNELQKL